MRIKTSGSGATVTFRSTSPLRALPYKCNWCAKPIYGNRYNSRSPERVAAEIEMLIQRYGVRHFWMADDISSD